MAIQAWSWLFCHNGQATRSAVLSHAVMQCATAPARLVKCGWTSNTLSRAHAGCNNGIQVRWLCLVAATTTLRQRSCLSTRRSLRCVHTGITSSTPSSVAFSSNHSNRSVALVGATTKVRPWGRRRSSWMVSTCTEALRLPTAVKVPSACLPAPSTKRKASPSCMRKTRTTCKASSSGRAVTPAWRPGWKHVCMAQR